MKRKRSGAGVYLEEYVAVGGFGVGAGRRRIPDCVEFGGRATTRRHRPVSPSDTDHNCCSVGDS